jgi:hypothetical protein
LCQIRKISLIYNLMRSFIDINAVLIPLTIIRVWRIRIIWQWMWTIIAMNGLFLCLIILTYLWVQLGLNTSKCWTILRGRFFDITMRLLGALTFICIAFRLRNKILIKIKMATITLSIILGLLSLGGYHRHGNEGILT